MWWNSKSGDKECQGNGLVSLSQKPMLKAWHLFRVDFDEPNAPQGLERIQQRATRGPDRSRFTSRIVSK